jgi:CBS domain-containing protein
VAEAVLARPTVHGPATTVGELRAFFRDDHVHMALIVDAGTLLAAVERGDLEAAADELPASGVGTLAGRTIHPDVLQPDALERMRREHRRRLAVTDAGGGLVGLLCMKSSGDGFCSDEGVDSRRLERARGARPLT